MAALRFERVAALPGTLTASTLYMLQDPADANVLDIVVTGNTGEVITKTLTKTQIETIATTAASTAVTDFNNVLIYPVYADMTAATRDRNSLNLVLDATGDVSVGAGAALYVYNHTDTSFTKVAEYESMDVTIDWSSIQNKPTSSVAQLDSAVSQMHTHSSSIAAIDAAVAASHSHANSAVLDLLTAPAGQLLYNGAGIDANLAASEW